MNNLLARLAALEEKQKPTVASLKKAVVQYSARPTLDFDKYKALDMIDQLRYVAVQLRDKKADYFSSVHSLLLEKVNKPTEQFKNYVLSLVGDRDYEKIVETVAKIDKSFQQTPAKASDPPAQAQGQLASTPQVSFAASPYGFPPFPWPYYPKQGLPQNKQPSGRGFRRRHCYFCGKQGHMANQCFKKQNQGNYVKKD